MALRDINQIMVNLKEKLAELIERGLDLDEIFYEMRDDEELKYEKQLNIDVQHSAIAKYVKFRCTVALQVPERKRNADIQTYNVDFLLD